MIAVIAILAGILLPALSGAKSKARSIQCLNNVRQITLSYRQALDEDPSDQLIERGVSDWVIDQMGLKQNGWICPDAPVRPERATRSALVASGETTIGWVDSAWTEADWKLGKFAFHFIRDVFNDWNPKPKARAGSYTMNWHLISSLEMVQLWPDIKSRSFFTEGRIKKPSLTPILQDGVVPSEAAYPERDGQLTPTWVYGSSWGTDFHSALDFFKVPRHGSRPARLPARWAAGQRLPGAVNVGFFDGHAALVPLPQLRQLTWHYSYDPSAAK